MKQVTLETFLTMLAITIHTVAPIIFYAAWVILILVGKILVRDGSLSTKRFFFSVLIGAPIGVLSALALQDYFQTTNNIAALGGCCVAIMAEQILNGNIPSKISDAFINKINKA